MNKNEKNKPTTFFSTSQLDSFAYFTIKERFPKIYNDYCSGNFDDFIENTTVEDALKNIFKQNECSDLSFIQGKETKTLKEFFENEPFFESEVLFYHVLLAQKEYFKNIIEKIGQNRIIELTHMTNSFLKSLTTKKYTWDDIKADMALKGLSGKNYVHAIGKWDEYIEYIVNILH